jgi:ribonucleoside-diphosphate reductase alpha chain
MDAEILAAANKAWDKCLTLGEKNGYRNAQASLLAPTGCLTGDTLVATDRGLVRLAELGDPYGDQWQDLDLLVSTDEGPRRATKFFLNGEEPTRTIRTEGGYRIQGTLAHRVKVVGAQSGAWEWKRLADIVPGDLLPMQLGILPGAPRRVPLPVLDQAYYAGDRHLQVPGEVSADLAELVGYFMGEGSLHAKGVRLCVADSDLDVAERLSVLSKELFGLSPVVTQQEGYQEVVLQSVRLARWWQAAGFAKILPEADHVGKGWVPRQCTPRSCAGCLKRTARLWTGCRASPPPTTRSPGRSVPCCWRSAWPPRPGRPPADGAVTSSRCGCATSIMR